MHGLTEFELQRLAQRLQDQAAASQAAMALEPGCAGMRSDDVKGTGTGQGQRKGMLAAASASPDRRWCQRQEIADAQDRIARNCYGLCVDCGLVIGFSRLSASPTARRCAVCEGLAERAPRRAHARPLL